jgi:hypothetical protein
MINEVYNSRIIELAASIPRIGQLLIGGTSNASNNPDF